MLNTTNPSPSSLAEFAKTIKQILQTHHHGTGLLVFILTLLVLSFVAGVHPRSKAQVYMVGDIAENDIVAQRSLMVEDREASRARRNQVAQMQPNVFDFSVAEIVDLREKIFHILEEVNKAEQTGTMHSLVDTLSTRTGAGLTEEVAELWAVPRVQAFILNEALPWFDKALQEGVVNDTRMVLSSQNGILIRDMDTGLETLRTQLSDIRDTTSLLASFNQWLRSGSVLSPMERRAVYVLFSPQIMPTLTLNREATISLGNAVAKSVEPVYYHIQQGEVIVYQGERITREKQLKIQSLYSQQGGLWQRRLSAGLFVVSLLISLGLYMSPSGKVGTGLRRKDFLFISLLLFCTGIGAKASLFLINRLDLFPEMTLLMYAFPIPGIAGLCTLIFAARRYCVMGILLALFSTIMFKGSIPLFMFFFFSSMLSTWLVVRSLNRQDVVLSIFPLAFGLCCIAIGCGWMEGFKGGHTLVVLCGLVCFNAFISLGLLFAFSPIIEMAFRYTTRFRLMELMNLEQPLLQELMVTIPGTYHHSLVVANMVEAGARAIGANSLLCKVAALYHDVGKLAYPEYFIENQFNGPNRHDKLAPNMSALVLISHVKKGTELATKHHVGDEIVDIIRQHHGTSLIKFFYNKAKEMGENPRVEDYCYPGPRPQTREAAIVMLADVAEASSRTLAEPTPARIKTHIDTIIKNIFADGQLDESELTFKDLHKLADNFARILTGIFHQRIAYPDVTKKAAEAAEVKAEGKESKPEIKSIAEKTQKPVAIEQHSAVKQN